MGNDAELDHVRLTAASPHPFHAMRRPLGRTGMRVSPIGFGAFKIGRNTGVKYAGAYDLPDDAQSDQLLRAIVDDLGINFIDTAPAYGTSEARVGRALGSRGDVVISTKVGETFDDGVSRFDFSRRAVSESLARSRERLGRDLLDLVLIHSNGDDQHVLKQTDVVDVLRAARESGSVRAIGFSGKTVVGARSALAWSDAIMVEFHLDDRSHAEAMRDAGERGVGVLVKKGLASGRLPAPQAVDFVLSNPAVSSMVIGGLNIEHLRANVEIAARRG